MIAKLRTAAIASAIATLFLPTIALAATTAQEDVSLAVGPAALRILKGSAYDSYLVENNALKVVVPAGEAFELRSSGLAYAYQNDIGRPVCHVIKARENQMLLSGPITATIQPAMPFCSLTNASNDRTAMLVVGAPLSGTVVKAGTTEQITWSRTDGVVSGIRIRLSTDGGATYPTVVVDNNPDDGHVAWNIPANTVSTTAAKLKVEAVTNGDIVAFAVGQTFTIEGIAAPALSSGGTISVTSYDYDPSVETAEAESIGIDRRYPSADGIVSCTPEVRIKVKGLDTVYYCGRDGKRHVFPNKKTHDTWYSGFNGVVELTMEEMQRIPLGRNVSYRPGVRLVKVTTAPEVFAVAANGVLRHVTEAQAVKFYGPDWNTKIDDIPDAFFVDYVVGEPVKE